MLTVEDPQKGSMLSKCHPITCLAMRWKFLMRILAGEFYHFIEARNVLPEEQQGLKKGCRNCLDLFHINKKIMKELKHGQKDIAMCWLDYRKAYDLV